MGNGQQSRSVLDYRRAFNFALTVGLPANVPFQSMDLNWQIAPNDQAITAGIEIRGASVVAVLSMNYRGRTVQMVRLSFDGKVTKSEGLLFKDNMEKACNCFRAHLDTMLYGPVGTPVGKVVMQ
ncbi:hypothetical protein ACKF11_12995 [Methylobacillus sp. Pita2]|uniref:hypothetical protein n=1 Tax=Methylobacillus sp. Pita2 TaxID=3383245 RepID=UPI0038B52DF3